MIFYCISGATRLAISNDDRVYFDANDPTLIDYEEFQDVYSKADNIAVVLYRDEKTGIFEAETLSAIKSLTDSLWQPPFSIRVDSIANFQNVWSDSSGLKISDLISLEYVEEVVAKFSEEHSNLKLAVSGRVALGVEFARASERDMQGLFPLLLLTATIIFGILLRSPGQALLVLSTFSQW